MWHTAILFLLLTGLFLEPMIGPFNGTRASALPEETTSLTGFPEVPAPAVPGVPVLQDVPLRINIFFLGFPNEWINLDEILRNLPTWSLKFNERRLRETGIKEIYVNYTLTYHLRIGSQALTESYVSFLWDTAYTDVAPLWLADNGVETSYYIGAKEAEAWLRANIPTSRDGFTLVVANTLASSAPFDWPYFYDGTTADPDTGALPYGTASQFLIAYGGDARFFFVDLAAGPTLYEGSLNAGVRRVDDYDFTNSSQVLLFNHALAYYITGAVRHWFAPSSSFRPPQFANFRIRVTIFSNASEMDYESLLNSAAVEQALRSVYGDSNFSVEASTTDLAADVSLNAVVRSSMDSEGRLDSSTLATYLSGELQRFLPSDPTSIIIPVFIFGGFQLKTGASRVFSNGSGDFWLAIEALDSETVDLGIGLSAKVLHLLAQALGSPGASTEDPTRLPVYDFSSSWASPVSLVLSPDQLDLDAIFSTLAAFRLNQTGGYLNGTRAVYRALGFGATPPTVALAVNASLREFTLSKQYFLALSPDYVLSAETATQAERYGRAAYEALLESLVTLAFVATDVRGQPLGEMPLRITFPNGTATVYTTGGDGKKVTGNLPWGEYAFDVSEARLVQRGSRLVFVSWADGNSSPMISRTVMTDLNLSATYKTQFLLEVTSPYGNVSGAGWYDQGAISLVTISPAIVERTNSSRHVFRGWTGDLLSEATEIMLRMDSPKSVVAEWKSEYLVLIESLYATTTGSGWYDEGTRVTFALSEPLLAFGNGTRRIFLGWQGDFRANDTSAELEVSGPKRITTVWKTQYYLTVRSPYGIVSGEGWYDAESAAQFSVTDRVSSGFLTYKVFEGWSGDYAGQTPTGFALMNAPKSVVAIWRDDFTELMVLGAFASAVTIVAFFFVRRVRGKRSDNRYDKHSHVESRHGSA